MPGACQVGDRIADRFEVFEVHRGGMGIVYLVRDRLGRGDQDTVALKTLHDEFLPDPVANARFGAECRLWVRLGRHPHIVQAFAVQEIDGKPHIVLERVTGGELRGRIGTDRVDPVQALRYGVEFCLGMEHAMRQGLRCHRDIKPGNLLVTGEGALKITDFGLAGVRDDYLAANRDLPDGPIPLSEVSGNWPIVWDDPRDLPAPAGVPSAGAGAPPAPDTDPGRPAGIEATRADSDPETHERIRPVVGGTDPHETLDFTPPGLDAAAWTANPRLTRTGVLLGTLPYMAPEQFLDAREVDVRADIYSFGVVLFQMLTTELPFKGDTVAKLARQHARYDPPSVVPALPRLFTSEARRIDGIVRRCLAKEPDDRYPTVVALRRALLATLRRLNRGYGWGRRPW